MKDTGLTENEVSLICSVFNNHPLVDIVKLYGSRAKGNFNNRSDIDLVAYGKKLNRFEIADLLMDLNDLDIPYMRELQDYSNIQNQRLLEHIDRVAIIFYTTNSH